MKQEELKQLLSNLLMAHCAAERYPVGATPEGDRPRQELIARRNGYHNEIMAAFQKMREALPDPQLLERAALAHQQGVPDIKRLREAASRIWEVRGPVR